MEFQDLGNFIISIHAPPRGATEKLKQLMIQTIYFNSRPSARGDPFAQNVGQNYIAISIHAPPRGATGVWIVVNPDKVISIHAPPRGATIASVR